MNCLFRAIFLLIGSAAFAADPIKPKIPPLPAGIAIPSVSQRAAPSPALALSQIRQILDGQHAPGLSPESMLSISRDPDQRRALVQLALEHKSLTDAPRLVIQRQANPGKHNAFFGSLSNRDVFAKIVSADEAAAHILTSVLALPKNIVVPEVLLLGRPGLPEITQVQNLSRIGSGNIDFFRSAGRRLMVTARAPKNSISLGSAYFGPEDADKEFPALPLEERAPRKIWLEVLKAFGLIHKAGITHDDLDQPKNILVSPAGPDTKFYLIDWGRSYFADSPSFGFSRKKDRSDLSDYTHGLRNRGRL